MEEVESPLRFLNKTSNISTPYIKKLKLHADTIPLPPIADDSKASKSSLSSMAIRENQRVQFLLELLGNIIIYSIFIKNQTNPKLKTT